jgi:mannitol/fructose-specific phosphotransferase system IIA component (Ntr-type)
MLTRNRIAANVSVDDWESAVRAVGKLMHSTGCVEERYIDAMIDTVNELGPYIVIAPGIAMPHALPEKGVIEPCMAILTLDPPINFGNPDNDPVHIVIAFGAVDQNQHVDALRQMASVLSNEQNVQAIGNARSEQDILEIMSSYDDN